MRRGQRWRCEWLGAGRRLTCWHYRAEVPRGCTLILLHHCSSALLPASSSKGDPGGRDRAPQDPSSRPFWRLHRVSRQLLLSCARGGARWTPGRAPRSSRAGPARRGAADGGRFRPAQNFPNSWGQGSRAGWRAIQAYGVGTVRPAGSRACGVASANLGFPPGLRCGSAQPPGWPPL